MSTARELRQLSGRAGTIALKAKLLAADLDAAGFAGLAKIMRDVTLTATDVDGRLFRLSRK